MKSCGGLGLFFWARCSKIVLDIPANLRYNRLTKQMKGNGYAYFAAVFGRRGLCRRAVLHLPLADHAVRIPCYMTRAEAFQPLERALRTRGFACVCGVDEAGRGPLAGEVFAAAVILPEKYDLPGLDDSKKLSEKKREALFGAIQEQAAAWAIASASLEEIERLNILHAALLAMTRAVEALPVPADYALIDGNQRPKLAVPCETIVKGDALCASIAAASVLAKVARDRAMEALDEQYPGYGFARHKGYPTAAHYEALACLGPCPVHRKTFRLYQ